MQKEHGRLNVVAPRRPQGHEDCLKPNAEALMLFIDQPPSPLECLLPLSTSDQCVSIDQVCAPGVCSAGAIKQTLPHLQQKPLDEEALKTQCFH